MKIMVFVTCSVGMFFFFSTHSVRGALFGQDKQIPIDHYLSPAEVQKLTNTLEQEPASMQENLQILFQVIFGNQ
ncbi:MAG: hypothetical protein HYW48_09660 [Deltaproteobacteria bacterium]|nr:hypothetical protein [Deltaproteobacteria bacterium]